MQNIFTGSNSAIKIHTVFMSTYVSRAAFKCSFKISLNRLINNNTRTPVTLLQSTY